MKDRPILMRGRMVVATLEDRKTKTRRVMKPQPDLSSMRWTGERWEMSLGYPLGHDVPPCPRGGVGDRLWVRETFALVPTTAYIGSGVPYTICPADTSDSVIYRAGWDRSTPGTRWRPSIHMPRWASRLTLSITDVAVERLQDITEADKRAEGFDEAHGYGPAAFADFWDQLNAKRGYPWSSNPWVWVIAFARLESEVAR